MKVQILHMYTKIHYLVWLFEFNYKYHHHHQNTLYISQYVQLYVLLILLKQIYIWLGIYMVLRITGNQYILFQ